MSTVKSEKKCTPCRRSAALNIGDAICHRMRGAIDCHGLVKKVERGDITVDRFLDILASHAKTESERDNIKRIKQIMYEEGG